MEFAEAAFRDQKPVKSAGGGEASAGAHLRQLEKWRAARGLPAATETETAAVEITDCPPEMLYLWRIFCRLREAAGSTGFGAKPIGYSDMAAYGHLMSIALKPWEVEVIVELDRLFSSVMHEK